MQEDKEGVFDALDTVKMCIGITTPMISTMTVLKDNMKRAAQEGFINATDLADYLVKKGMPFRTAYKISGTVVAECIKRRCVLETFPLDDYKSYSDLIEDDIYKDIALETCVAKRISLGGTSADSAKAQIEFIENELNK
jgi:argininosuccinate lyase